MKSSSQTSNYKEKLLERYKDKDQNELLIELIWELRKSNGKNEKIRENTSKLVWWLIAIPIIIGLIIGFISLAGIASL
ncbi:MAG TPA: hypothetical protein DEA82_13315 [Flavobacteriaceae bacterium]|nr:hypothetical protein [Flavobacteriaceae bacterium]HBR55099.1 hypothetical protein [Flavobacteriaceae bacterium]